MANPELDFIEPDIDKSPVLRDKILKWLPKPVLHMQVAWVDLRYLTEDNERVRIRCEGDELELEVREWVETEPDAGVQPRTAGAIIKQVELDRFTAEITKSSGTFTTNTGDRSKIPDLPLFVPPDHPSEKLAQVSEQQLAEGRIVMATLSDVLRFTITSETYFLDVLDRLGNPQG
ncbi:hypothetical protein BH10PAT3_BH10PAT3_5000 [soil metagenome]